MTLVLPEILRRAEMGIERKLKKSINVRCIGWSYRLALQTDLQTYA